MSKNIAVSVANHSVNLDNPSQPVSGVSEITPTSASQTAELHCMQARAMAQNDTFQESAEGAIMDHTPIAETLPDKLSHEPQSSLPLAEQSTQPEPAPEPASAAVDPAKPQAAAIASDFDELHAIHEVHSAETDFLLDPISDPSADQSEKHEGGIEMLASSFVDYGRASKIEDARKIDPNQDYYKPWLQSYPEDVPEFVDTHCYETLDDLFMTAVEAHAEHTAYVNMESSLTYDEVGELATAFAAFLQVNLGLKKGDKLAIMMPNLMQYPIVFFGAIKAGLVVININPLYTPRELQLMLSNSDASAIVVLANVAHNLQPIIDKTNLKHVIIASVGDCLGTIKGMIVDTVLHFRGMVPHFELKNTITLRTALRRGLRKIGDFVKPDMAYDDIALLQYTGGTTGRSKGAMLSHGNLIANVAQAIGVYGSKLNGTQETILTVIPLYHIFALTVNLLLMFEIGAKNILITDPRNTKDFVKTLQKHPEISTLTGVNTLFNILVTHPDFQDIKFENLHLVIGGGSAVQSGVEQRFFERTGLHILEGYGLTECSPLCSVCPYTTDHYTGSIGLIVPSTIARIVDVNGDEIRDLESTGELEIKGPQVMHGYYKCSKEQNELAFDDGFLRTGDIAHWMEGGYIKLIDRLKDMILVSGFNVFPSEIEDVVSRFNRVLECAVIGVPSEKTGEAVKMYVVKKDPDLTEEEVRNYCRAYLTPYKVPSIIEFVKVLPKSGLGKVLRRKLRETNLEPRGEPGANETDFEMDKTEQKPVASADASTVAGDGNSEVAASAQGQGQPDQSEQQGQAASAEQSHSSEQSQAQAPESTAAAADGQKAGAKEQVHRTAGVMALERLLSSHSDGFGAATSTPNIHRQEVRSTKWLREDQKPQAKLESEQDSAAAPAQTGTKTPQVVAYSKLDAEDEEGIESELIEQESHGEQHHFKSGTFD